MKKLYSILIAACLSVTVMAQDNYKLGKPNNDNYRYLDSYENLKEYINTTKYTWPMLRRWPVW